MIYFHLYFLYFIAIYYELLLKFKYINIRYFKAFTFTLELNPLRFNMISFFFFFTQI